jgi:hypothetical protein
MHENGYLIVSPRLNLENSKLHLAQWRGCGMLHGVSACDVTDHKEPCTESRESNHNQRTWIEVLRFRQQNC